MTSAQAKLTDDDLLAVATWARGAAADDLAAVTSSDILRRLQALDVVMPLPSDGGSQATTLEGPLFARKFPGRTDVPAISYQDIRQGSLNDCQSLSPLMSMAAANPQAIEQLITDRGDGVYIVHATGVLPGVVVDVEIDATIYPARHARPDMVFSPGENGDYLTDPEGNYVRSPELWVVLLEKAWQVLSNGEHTMPARSIDRVEYGGSAPLLFGNSRDVDTAAMGDDAFLEFCQLQLDAGCALTVSSSATLSYNAGAGRNKQCTDTGSSQNPGVPVFKDHQYAIVAVDLAAKRISIANPHGSNHFLAETVEIARALFAPSIRVFDGEQTKDALTNLPHVDASIWYFERGFYPTEEFTDDKVLEILVEAAADPRASRGIEVNLQRTSSGMADKFLLESLESGVLTLTAAPDSFADEPRVIGTLAELRPRVQRLRYAPL